MSLSLDIQRSVVNIVAPSSSSISMDVAAISWRILHTESSMGLGGQEYRVVDEAWGMKQRGHEVVSGYPEGQSDGSPGRAKRIILVN